MSPTNISNPIITKKTPASKLLVLIIVGFILLLVLFSSVLAAYYFVSKNESKNNNSSSQNQNNNSNNSENQNNNVVLDEIVLDNLKVNDTISSSFKVTGKAKGSWFFEGQFVVDVVDSDSVLLGTNIAKAKSDWMTDSMVPFEAELKFTKSLKTEGKVIFKKDNPSGDAQNDKSYEVKVKYDFSKSEIVGNDEIHVFNLVANQKIATPVVIKGEAKGWFFEGTFPVEVKGSNGSVLGTGVAKAESDWTTTDFVKFTANISFTRGSLTSGKVVFKNDNPSGKPEFEKSFEIPVTFPTTTTQTLSLKIYFSNSVKNPNIADCTKVFPVTRTVPYTQSVGKVAIEELLKGVTTDEKNNGYSSSLNTKVKLNSLKVENKTAYADFNSELNKIGGSCATSLVTAQITETLKQFSSVEKVVISVDGKTENILQP